jgi:flagellar basal-body rod protein FlgB
MCPNRDTGSFFHVVNIALLLARQLLIYKRHPNAMLDPVAGSLDQYMSLVSARQKLVASNIANADTPGYSTKDIDFQSEFQNALSGSSQSPSVINVQGLTMKNDGNNVNLDREAKLLSENALRFTVASNLLRSQIKIVHMAIDGGGSSS